MIITTHNTNNGDGWEREAEDEGYFREYSENRAYPLAIQYYLLRDDALKPAQATAI